MESFKSTFAVLFCILLQIHDVPSDKGIKTIRKVPAQLYYRKEVPSNFPLFVKSQEPSVRESDNLTNAICPINYTRNLEFINNDGQD